MKKIKKSIKLATIVAALGMGVSSCSLDLLPLNEVVLENFWTEKSDVESVVASCYSTFHVQKDRKDNKYIHNILVWGEGRSDNTIVGPDASDALKYLMKGSIKTTNEYCDWAPLYELINRCNTVIKYAPEVAANDPNYTESDLRINLAECKALRDMTYFYLIKTFKDVPLTFEPTVDDDIEKMYTNQTPFNEVLDVLIEDLEGCVGDAPVRYHEYEKSIGRITRPAIQMLLSEMYLWRASDATRSVGQQKDDYDKCYQYAQKVIDVKKKLYTDNGIEGINLTRYIDKNVYSLYGYPLMAEVASGSSVVPFAFNWGFCDALSGMSFYSFESIFEYAAYYQGTYHINNAISQLYGGSNEQNQEKTFMLADANIMSTLPTGTEFGLALFPTATDIRSISSFSWEDGASFKINKYSNMSVSTKYDGKSVINYTVDGVIPKHKVSSTSYHNFVFYRLSEALLFQAEAEIEYAKLLNQEASDELKSKENDSIRALADDKSLASKSVDELKAHALKLICANYLRSNPFAYNSRATALPNEKVLKTLDEYEDCLMKERRREFLFEGKRYYDLVRQARREGNTNKFISNMTAKYADGGASVAIKMKKMDFLYMPVLKKQIQINPMLKQNSAYLDEETLENN